MIIIVGILSALGGSIITTNIEGYLDMSRRAELVGSAGSALRRMQRDVRSAVPNSVQTLNEYEGISILHAIDGGRYRTSCPKNSSGCTEDDILQLTSTTQESFATIGFTFSDDLSDETIIIYNLGKFGGAKYNAYNNKGQKNNTFPIKNYKPKEGFKKTNLFTIDSQNFPSLLKHVESRFQIMDSQVFYVKDEYALKRCEIEAGIIDPDDFNLSNLSEDQCNLVTRHVKNADFIYEHGNNTSSALLTLKLTLEDEGESISLLHEVHVLNTP